MNEKAKLFLELVRNEILAGDGAIGTELIKRSGGHTGTIESLNLDAPVLVKRLHEDYIAAGSRVIETNSFGANRINLAFHRLENKMPDINRASVLLAREAAGDSDVFIAGSVGPIREIHEPDGEGVSLSDKQKALTEQALLLAEYGADILVLETFIDIDELTQFIRAIRASSDIPVIAQMSFEENGRTPQGDDGASVARALIEAGADVVGANCGGGVPAVMKAVSAMLGAGRPVSAFINAGFGEQLEGRQVFTAGDSYLAERAAQLAGMGVRLIGGCCGTTPDTIRMISARLRSGMQPGVIRLKPAAAPEKKISVPEPPAVPRGILVELDPPKDLNMDKIRSCAADLANAGVRYITLADNPLASVRIDNIAVAGILMRESGVMPIPHMTGRDRNRIALQSSMMAAHCTGIRHLLCVTGDPVRMYHEANTSGVFDVNSVTLVKMATEFNLGQRLNLENRTSFAIGVAFNPNVRNLEGQMNKLLRKIEAGAHFVLTQPVYTAERLEAVLESFSLYHVDIPLFCGIMPLTSAKNAEYLHNEVPGIVIPDRFRETLNSLPQLDDQKKAARELSIEMVGSCLKLNRLFYLITPRNDASFILPLVDFLKENRVPVA